MTIHQAKNREFDHVVVFWTYQVSGDEEQQRRLLYNAITRARKSCLIILQDPSIRRVKSGLP
ncbi:MAG: ATP-binding domain-containing protein [Methylocystis sp.]